MRSDVRFDIMNADSGLRICKAEVTHIGANLPCTRIPDGSPADHDNFKLIYAGGVEADAHQCGKDVQMYFTVNINKTGIFLHIKKE